MLMTEIDGVEFLTTTEAKALADEMGIDVSQDAITHAARANKIQGAKKLWDNPKAPWLFSRKSFLHWLETRRTRGRPKKDEG